MSPWNPADEAKLLSARIAELEASERELRAERDNLQLLVDQAHGVAADLIEQRDRLREELCRTLDKMEVLVETYGKTIGERRRQKLLADLPAAAREHLARDAEREQALTNLRERIAGWRREAHIRHESDGQAEIANAMMQCASEIEEFHLHALEPPDA